MGALVYFIVPVVGGLLVGPLILFAQEAKGHGVPEVMQALIIRGGRIRARVAAAKIAASALCIGTGGSAGREGPIVQVGSALGSSLGQVLRLSDERIRNLVACGAAAGIAATFNAPIAGVVFAIEVLMCNLQVRSFGNVVIAAVSSSIVSRIFLGTRPAFSVPIHSFVSPSSLPFYLILGLLAALVGIMFIRMLNMAENIFDEWKFPQLLKPAIGAAPPRHIRHAFHAAARYRGYPDAIHVWIGISLYRGSSSGRFVPVDFAASCLSETACDFLYARLRELGRCFCSIPFHRCNAGRGALGIIFKNYFPEISGEPGAYALVGMAALFGATARAPLTAMLIVFEMSNDYLMILPLMVAGITATYFAQWLHPESIYTLKLAKRGIRFEGGRDMDIMQGVKVQEVMRTRIVSINKNQSVSELMALFQETNLLGFPVITEGKKLWGDHHPAGCTQGSV